MKNLKKFAALGLSAAMVLSLAACGSGTCARKGIIINIPLARY